MYLNDYETPRETRQSLTRYLTFYNEKRTASVAWATKRLPRCTLIPSEQLQDKGDEPNVKIVLFRVLTNGATIEFSAPLARSPTHIADHLDQLHSTNGRENAGVEALLEIGVLPIEKARKIVTVCGERLVLDWIAAVKNGHVDCSIRGPAAVLASALGGEKPWKLPASYRATREDQKRREVKDAEEMRRAQMRRQSDDCARQKKEAQAAAWDALSDEAREQIAAASAAIASEPMGQRLLQGPIGKETLRLRCLQMAEDRLDGTPKQGCACKGITNGGKCLRVKKLTVRNRQNPMIGGKSYYLPGMPPIKGRTPNGKMRPEVSCFKSH